MNGKGAKDPSMRGGGGGMDKTNGLDTKAISWPPRLPQQEPHVKIIGVMGLVVRVGVGRNQCRVKQGK